MSHMQIRLVQGERVKKFEFPDIQDAKGQLHVASFFRLNEIK